MMYSVDYLKYVYLYISEINYCHFEYGISLVIVVYAIKFWNSTHPISICSISSELDVY